MEGITASSDRSANLEEQSNKSMVKMGDSSVSTKVEKDKSGEHSGDSTNMEVQMEGRTASSDGSASLKEQSNKIKSMVKMDDSSVSNTKLEKDKSREHSGNSTNMEVQMEGGENSCDSSCTRLHLQSNKCSLTTNELFPVNNYINLSGYLFYESKQLPLHEVFSMISAMETWLKTRMLDQ